MQKNIFPVLLVLLIMVSCNQKKQKTSEKLTQTDIENKELLNDIWVLEKMYNSNYADNIQKTIQLGFNSTENRFYGNDGCNQILGVLLNLNNSTLQFGEVSGTKMLCRNMEIPNQYLESLKEVRKYRIEDSYLHLINEHDSTILIFKKKIE